MSAQDFDLETRLIVSKKFRKGLKNGLLLSVFLWITCYYFIINL